MPNFSYEATISAQYLTVIVYLQIRKALWLFVRELLSVVDLLSICLPVKDAGYHLPHALATVC